MPKNEGNNKFMIFAREYQERVRREEGRHMSIKEAVPLAGVEWQAMSAEQRQMYKDRSTNARQNQLPPVSSRAVWKNDVDYSDRGSKIKKTKEEYPKRDFRVVFTNANVHKSDRRFDVNSFTTSWRWSYDDRDLSVFYEEISKKRFYFASCENVGFQEVEELYPAVELSLVEFTLADGVLQRHNFYIVPPTTSIENVQKAKLQSQHTHKLFPKPKPTISDQFKMNFYDCNSDSSSLWREIYELIVTRKEPDDLGAVYCLASEYFSVQSAFWQIKSDALSEKKLPVNFFKDTGPKSVKCVEDLLQSILKYADQRDPTEARVRPKAAIDSHSFEDYFSDTNRSLLLTEKCPCEFHSALTSSHCALAKATATCWSFFKILRDKNVIRTPLVPGKHGPTMEKQDTRLSLLTVDTEVASASDHSASAGSSTSHTFASQAPAAAYESSLGSWLMRVDSLSSMLTFCDDDADAQRASAHAQLAAPPSGFGVGPDFFPSVKANVSAFLGHTFKSHASTQPVAIPSFELSRANPTATGFRVGAGVFSNFRAATNTVPDVPHVPTPAVASGFSYPIRRQEQPARISAQSTWGDLSEQFSAQISGIGQSNPPPVGVRMAPVSLSTQRAVVRSSTQQPRLDVSPMDATNSGAQSRFQNVGRQFSAFGASTTADYGTARPLPTFLHSRNVSRHELQKSSASSTFSFFKEGEQNPGNPDSSSADFLSGVPKSRYFF